MPLLVPIHDAANAALASYLSIRFLDDGYTGSTAVTVEGRWPDANRQLPARAITILCAGAPNDTDFNPPTILSRVNNANPAIKNAVYTWQVLSRAQPFQMDVWAQSGPARSDLVARVEDYLRRGNGATLGLANADPVRDGCLLAIGGGWTGNAEFDFAAPENVNDGGQAERAEWRATFRGEARMVLTQQATSARLARVIFKTRLSESGSASTAADTWTYPK